MIWFERAIRDHERKHGPSGPAWNTSALLECLRAASAIETRSAETEGFDPKDESATAKPGRPKDAQ